MRTAAEIIAKRKHLWEQHRDIEKDQTFTQATAEYIVGSEGESIRQEIQNNPELLVEMVFVIVDKNKQTVPFFINTVQWLFINDLKQAIEDFKAGRRLHLKFLVLKGRQQGFTSIITAYQLACSITKRNFAGFTLADDADNTETIFEDKAKYPYGQLPEVIKPTEKYNNRREFHFDKLNSRWRVATAGSKGVGRSKTLNFFHGSEAAFWSEIIAMLAGLGQALTQDSIQILESTANGYNEYKDLWDDDNNWEGKFYAWWLTPEYRQDFESKKAETEFKQNVAEKPDWIFTKCKWLVEFIKLDWQQVYWYCNKWLDLKDLIKQEYPCSADEAFLASGRCVFDKEKLIQQKEYLLQLYKDTPPKRGNFRFEWENPETQDLIKDDTIQFIENQDGCISIYEDAQQGYPYVLGGDTKGEGRDKYAGTVINNATGKRCATLHMQATNSKPYTHQMYCLGKYFNDALIGVEMNFNTAPIEELQRLRYPRQYTRKQYDIKSKKLLEKFGWKTDGNTRPLIIDKEIDLIENNTDLFVDITFIDECLTFIYDKDGRPDAESGKHDDVLISDMIGNEIRTQQTTQIKIPEPQLTGDAKRIHDHIESMVKKKKGKRYG